MELDLFKLSWKGPKIGDLFIAQDTRIRICLDDNRLHVSVTHFQLEWVLFASSPSCEFPRVEQLCIHSTREMEHQLA